MFQKPVDISNEQWQSSLARAKTYLTRAYNVFPNKNKSFYIRKVENFIQADLITQRKKGAK